MDTASVWDRPLPEDLLQPLLTTSNLSSLKMGLYWHANLMLPPTALKLLHHVKVWSPETLQCMQTVIEHTSVVMSLLCRDQFLLLCSLDKTIKVWAATESGNLEVTYTHNEEYGVHTLCGMPDSEGKPVLLCSCNDNSVRFYDLPAYSERGKICQTGDSSHSARSGWSVFYW